MKGLISKKQWHLVKDDRNRPTLELLGLTYDDVRDTLLKLTAEDYCRGPEPDRDPRYPGDVWVFVKNAVGSVVEIYIKLNLHPKGHHITVISFHPPDNEIKRHFQ